MFLKSSTRKTRRGNVIKTVKEHYLRSDISCGLNSCSICKNSISIKQINASNIKFLVPDENTLFNNIDLFEHKSITHVILLQSVLDALSSTSIHIYNRVRVLAADVSKSFYVFSNEFHCDTFIPFNRTISNRVNLSIIKAVEWYSLHLNKLSNNSSILIISTNQDLITEATSKTIPILPVLKYIESFNPIPELLDIVASATPPDQIKFTFPPHLSTLQVNSGIKSGLLLQGVLNVNPNNYLDASIFASITENGVSVENKIIINGSMGINRAVHGDVVAVELLPKEEWKSDDAIVIQEEDENQDSIDEMVIDQPQHDLKPTGKVVGIIKRNWRPYCGTIEAPMNIPSNSQSVTVNFWPFDKKIPKIRIRTRQLANLLNKRIVVSIDNWSDTSKNPSGHFVKILGDVGDKMTETQLLLLEFDVSYTKFSDSVDACLPKEGDKWVVDEDRDLAGRKDLRDLNVCSIDPPGCTDIDDALHARLLPNGNYSVGVHIADVSHFVKDGNAMDLEASKRGTTVYLVDKRIDMLPPLLGTNLCSLHSNVDRLAFSVIWEMTPEAVIVGVEYSKSIIRSRASFTYDEAQARLDDPNKKDAVSIGIKSLNMLAKKLRLNRLVRGALVLASPEVRFSLENSSQDPIDVEMKELKDTNALVEEFMLLANIYVAKKISHSFPDSSMLRRHPKPPATNFEGLKKALGMYDLEIDTTTSKTLADSLDTAQVKSDPYFNQLVRIMTTRCMMQAVYFCSGTLTDPEFWHYGLASEIYTHFTSPIRRYADLVVHRLLAASIGYDKQYSSSLTDKSKMTELSAVLNYRHRQAQMASRASVELYTNLFFKGKIVQEDGYVIRVVKNAFTVLIPKYGIEGVVFGSPDSKSVSPFVYNPELNSLTAGNTTIKLFTRVFVNVSVEEAGVKAAQRSKLVVKLVEPMIPGLSIPKL